MGAVRGAGGHDGRRIARSIDAAEEKNAYGFITLMSAPFISYTSLDDAEKMSHCTRPNLNTLCQVSLFKM